MERLERCNLCGDSHFSLFAEMVGHKTKQRFSILTCDACSLMFVSPRLGVDDNRALYDEAYFNGDGFDVSVNYVFLDEENEARRGESAGTLAKIALFKPNRDIRVLDIGCGTGSLLRTLRNTGYHDVWGVELSEYAGHIAQQIAGVNVSVGDPLDVDLPLGSFDVINATEVIEHLRDPMASFKRIKSLLAPGGVFLYSTGNARGLYARVLGRRWPYLHPEGHLFYFNPETLSRYFRAVGLEPLSLDRLDPERRRAYLAAEDQMAHSVLAYVGSSDRGLKGLIFRTVGGFENKLVQRAVTRVVGKHRLPIAVNSTGPSEP